MKIAPVLVLENQSQDCNCGQAPAAYEDKVGGLWCHKCMAGFPFCWREVYDRASLNREFDLDEEIEQWENGDVDELTSP